MKILIADDELISRKMLEGVLTGWGYEVSIAQDGVEALHALRGENPPEIAILDWVMPGLEGSQICESVRKHQQGKYIYLLLVTAKACSEDIVRGLQAGADDYLIKPFDLLELQARLIAGRRVLDLQEQLIASRELLRHQAARDSVTGAWNYRGIMEIMHRELSRSRREVRPLGVILADIDHFKRINGAFGHLAGDAVLQQVARRMTTTMRPYDHIGRYGGEEFLMVLPGSDEAGTATFGERVRARLAEEPVHHADKTIPVTMSLGAVVYAPPRPVEIHTLLHAADAALYRAKNGGRNRIEMGSLAE